MYLFHAFEMQIFAAVRNKMCLFLVFARGVVFCSERSYNFYANRGTSESEWMSSSYVSQDNWH